jgi:hypothetical protein
VTTTYHDRVKVLQSVRTAPFAELWLPRLQRCVERGDVVAALRLLKLLVPAFSPSRFAVGEENADERVAGAPAIAG